ncbi:MAG: NAD(P)/FAD-dependent oxidoreductase [Lachnospiraceae bacterium]|nr:NAD(P)/FAD-dependent oxidoreductase [Lachnospiraceae bacterium]
MNYDVVVIGGGAVGCAIARELSRYQCRTALLEKEEDVCSGTSKANSAIVHAGYDAETGSKKAAFNVKGSAMMGALSKELDFAFRQNGSMVLCFSEDELPALYALHKRGNANGVLGLKLLSAEEARKLEPNLAEGVKAALYAPTGGIVCPFGMTIALAENACRNGVEFFLNTEVTYIEKEKAGYVLTTSRGRWKAAYVVNAAGVYADTLHNMVSERKLHIIPKRGEYCLFDKEAKGHVRATVFQLPGAYGKGVLVTPTVHGNLLIGPTAVEQESREQTATTAAGLNEVCKKAGRSVRQLPFGQVITSFAGLRAHEEGGDFIIGEAEDAPGFFDAAGIESPGLSCAPAIGCYLADLVARKGNFEKKRDFEAERKGIVHAAALPAEERKKLIAKRPDYGAIVCRCEEISEGEIVDAIRRPIGARSLDGIKRRVRQGMGRCQGGFCTPRAMEILARETGVSMEELCKNRGGSNLIWG